MTPTTPAQRFHQAFLDASVTSGVVLHRTGYRCLDHGIARCSSWDCRGDTYEVTEVYPLDSLNLAPLSAHAWIQACAEVLLIPDPFGVHRLGQLLSGVAPTEITAPWPGIPAHAMPAWRAAGVDLLTEDPIDERLLLALTSTLTSKEARDLLVATTEDDPRDLLIDADLPPGVEALRQFTEDDAHALAARVTSALTPVG